MDRLHAQTPVQLVLIPIVIGVWAAAIALTPTLAGRLILIAPAVAAAILAWILYSPGRWLYLFFFCLLALPPLPAEGGDSGLHVAPVAAAVGLLAGVLRLGSWRNLHGRLAVAFGVFLAVLLASTGLAATYSGKEIALGSLVRVVLFGLGVYVFAYTVTAEKSEAPDPRLFARVLFFLATAAAIFACIDFYYQLPAPAGYGPQFVWIGLGVFRRAQGLFYEASTLGNFCAFFLMFVLVCLFHPQSEIPVAKSKLLAAGAIFAMALIFSFSRGSILNIAIGAGALIWLRKGSVQLSLTRALAALCGLLLTAAILVRALLPSFSDHYWSRITASFQYASTSPDSVLSGRLTTWLFLGDVLWRQPWVAIFGIGYKTLPYSEYLGRKIVADNTYLQLLMETGIVGLLAFLALNAAIFRTGFRAARSGRPLGRLFGEWIFCFWAGEVVQMLSGDLITYWRVLPLYFWVLAVAAKETGEA